MTKRKAAGKTTAKSPKKKASPRAEAELDEAIADDFDERQKLAEPGRKVLREEILEHNSKTPELSADDIDADWDESDGAETVGGHAPTPDQDRVDDLGEAAGLTYADDEPLNYDKVAARDKRRWELNPASAGSRDELDDSQTEDDEAEDDLTMMDDEDEEELEELDLLDEDEDEDLDEAVEDGELGVLGILQDDEDEDEDDANGDAEDVEVDELDELDELDDFDDEDDDDDF